MTRPKGTPRYPDDVLPYARSASDSDNLSSSSEDSSSGDGGEKRIASSTFGLDSSDQENDVKNEEIRIVKKPKLEGKGTMAEEVEEEDIKVVDAPLTQLQLQRVKELKEFYNGSQIHAIGSEGSGDHAAGANSFVQDFQVSWYLNEAVAFFPDVSSVPQDSFTIARNRNLWFLHKARSNNWSNERPIPNFAVGSHVECLYPNTKVLRVLARHLVTNDAIPNKWKLGARNPRDEIRGDFSYAGRYNQEYSEQTLTVPSSLTITEAVELFLESEDHSYIKRLPSEYQSKAARKTLIVESIFDLFDYSGMAAESRISVRQLQNLRNFPLNAVKVFFRRTKDAYEYRFYMDTTQLEKCLKDPQLFKILGDYFKDNLRSQLCNPELGNTLAFVPRTPTQGFGLQLYDYQK
jgi:hypothetical protein